MTLNVKDATIEMGTSFAEVFGPNGDLQKGIGSAITGALVYGKSWKESIVSVVQTISSKLLNALIDVGVQLLFNTQKQLAFNAAVGAGGSGGGGSYLGASGGSGVVILSVPTANYSGTTTGSPTITTSGSNTIIRWTSGSGTYTA
jgi:hypothetical protein